MMVLENVNLLHKKNFPDETQRVQKFHIGIKIGSHNGFKQ